MIIPSMLLKKLYTLGSLKNAEDGVQFAVKNRLSDVELVGLKKIAVDGTPVPLDSLKLILHDGRTLTSSNVSPATPLSFPLRSSILVQTKLLRPKFLGAVKLSIHQQLVPGRRKPSER